ncbi:hypothetical protein NEOKW01_2031 [Nematocida sp. AWRm80]|nr:hypothetical protein NEOKW01_2031 [Nematocida sp. AWRm80]
MDRIVRSVTVEYHLREAQERALFRLEEYKKEEYHMYFDEISKYWCILSQQITIKDISKILCSSTEIISSFLFLKTDLFHENIDSLVLKNIDGLVETIEIVNKLDREEGYEYIKVFEEMSFMCLSHSALFPQMVQMNILNILKKQIKNTSLPENVLDTTMNKELSKHISSSTLSAKDIYTICLPNTSISCVVTDMLSVLDTEIGSLNTNDTVVNSMTDDSTKDDNTPGTSALESTVSKRIIDEKYTELPSFIVLMGILKQYDELIHIEYNNGAVHKDQFVNEYFISTWNKLIRNKDKRTARNISKYLERYDTYRRSLDPITFNCTLAKSLDNNPYSLVEMSLFKHILIDRQAQYITRIPFFKKTYSESILIEEIDQNPSKCSWLRSSSLLITSLVCGLVIIGIIVGIVVYLVKRHIIVL